MKNYNPGLRNHFAQLLDRASGKAPQAEPCLHRIPISHYTDDEHFQREWRGVFSKHPLVLCHESQLAEPGDALVHDWLGLPLVTVKDKQGQIATFMNVCRHRNVRLIKDAGYQKLRSFVCPYHNWTYGLDGKLRNIPRETDFTNINKAELGLVQLPTETRHGLVWLQLQAGGSMQLDRHLAGIGQDFDDFGLNSAVFYKNNTRELNCNWKLIQDAFLDGYHVIRLHKNTVGPFFPDCLALSEQHGLHVRSTVARNEIHDALQLPEDDWDPRTHCSFSYSMFPNSVLIMHPDYISVIALFPGAVDRTIFSHSMVVAEKPQSEKAIAHFDRSFELIDQGVFQAEDIYVSEAAQSAMHSGANREMLLGANELSVKMFHDSIEQEIVHLA